MTVSPEVLAAAFARHLRAQLNPETMEEVNRLNREEYGPNVCASHDFCDANMPMAEAFESLFGREVELNDDADLNIWAEAWDLAKAKGFWVTQ